MSTRIIHLSDLHIGKWLEFPPQETEEKNLKKLVGYLCDTFKNGSKPIILITGDLINDGVPQQYDKVKDLIKDLMKSEFIVWPIPGNHDYGRLGNHATKKSFKFFKKAFFDGENPHFPHENVVYPQIKKLNGHWFIGLNSMKGELGYLDGWLADGELGEKQLNNTVGVLKKLAARPKKQKQKEKVIVFLHHHPFIFPHDKADILEHAAEKVTHYLKDGEEFMQKIANLVDILLFGHDHEHINFSKTPLSKFYKIEYIFSCGKSTIESHELQVNKDSMNKKPQATGEKGLLGWDIKIDDLGKIKAASLVV